MICRHPQRAAGKGVTRALAEDDAQVEGALHDHGVSERKGKKGEEHSHGKQGPGRRHFQDWLLGEGGIEQEDEQRAKAEQRASGYHRQAAPGIGFRYVEELTDDRRDEDAERNRGKDIARELQRVKRGEVGLDKADVIKQAVLQRPHRRNDGNLRNNDQPLQPRITHVSARADGEVNAEQDERNEHPLKGEDLPKDGECSEKAGKVSLSTEKGRDRVHDAEKKPGIPFERPGQYHPISQQETECGEDQNEHDVDEPTSDVRTSRAPGRQLNLRGTNAAGHIAIDDGSHLPRTSMKGLTNQPCHAGEREPIHGKDLVFRHHASVLRLGERLHQEAGAMGVIERRPGAVGIEETVKVRSRAGGIKER